MKKLVIVESPAKAKTIEKYLGSKYKVLASIGHVRDLPKSKMGVNIEDDFEPQYITIRGKGPIISQLKKAKSKSSGVLIATDPDREGESIAWHLQHILSVEPDEEVRVSFQEITKDAVKNAVKNPRKINKNLVDAQQARRVMDRLVGYSISPVLWRKVMKGLSAGRVQSVATKLIVDRERKINAFVSEEYWNVVNTFEKDGTKFESDLVKIDNKKSKINNEKEAASIKKELEKAKYIVDSVHRKNRIKKAPMPYTTSTLQQDASIRLNFSSSRTMMNAQRLYEGIKIKGGVQGLITYMRTDSTRISKEASDSCKSFVISNFGDKYSKSRNTNSKSNSQDAHEAIRPTDVFRTPESLERYLKRDELKLYTLIWNRFVASQMSDAIFDSLKVDISAGKYQFLSKGEKLIFDGFMKVYKNGSKKDVILPDLKEGLELTLKKVEAIQKFTQPPSRFTEATLIKELEEKGIGRPSTYSPTLSTILKRGYVIKEKRFFKPTELGNITNEIMEKSFPIIVDYRFTADMEEKFDEISSGEKDWKKTIEKFYLEFEPLLKKAEEEIKKYDLSEMTDIDCEKCGSKMLIKKTIKGNFYACSNYPDCKNTKPILKKIGMKCPSCKDGNIVERKTKKLKIFYGCDNFPDCRFAVWDKPTDKKCESCGSIMLEGKGRNVKYLICSNRECKNKILKDEK